MQYTYDAANDITQRYTILNNSLINYSYDTLNRMSTRYVWNNGTGVSYETYGYDNGAGSARCSEAKMESWTLLVMITRTR